MSSNAEKPRQGFKLFGIFSRDQKNSQAIDDGQSEVTLVPK